MDLTKLGSSFLGGPYHKDYSMLGSMLGFHSFSGNTLCFGKVLDLCQIGGSYLEVLWHRLRPWLWLQRVEILEFGDSGFFGHPLTLNPKTSTLNPSLK